MKIMTLTDQTSGDDVVQTAAGEDLILFRDGRAVALVIPFDDDDLEWYGRERDPAFIASIARARRQVRQGDTRSHEDLQRELGLN